MSEKEDLIKEFNKKADDFADKYGELICLRLNIAAINKMFLDRNRGQELLDIFSKKIEDFNK